MGVTKPSSDTDGSAVVTDVTNFIHFPNGRYKWKADHVPGAVTSGLQQSTLSEKGRWTGRQPQPGPPSLGTPSHEGTLRVKAQT